ncbi:hypothetical protein BJX64DRAFT_272821, partial [Aspergillus heterothallicus]
MHSPCTRPRQPPRTESCDVSSRCCSRLLGQPCSRSWITGGGTRCWGSWLLRSYRCRLLSIAMGSGFGGRVCLELSFEGIDQRLGKGDFLRRLGDVCSIGVGLTPAGSNDTRPPKARDSLI